MTVQASPKLTDEASRLPAAAWLVLAIVLVADIMDLLDSTITTIAAPTISSAAARRPGLIKWPCQLRAGPGAASHRRAAGRQVRLPPDLPDRHRRFTAASPACGLAWDPSSIIVARLVQGASWRAADPAGLCSGSVFPRQHIGKAFSAFGLILGLSAVGGPLLASTC